MITVRLANLLEYLLDTRPPPVHPEKEHSRFETSPPPVDPTGAKDYPENPTPLSMKRVVRNAGFAPSRNTTTR